MNFAINPLLTAVGEPPIAEAISWIYGRTFPDDKPLVDLSRAAPGSGRSARTSTPGSAAPTTRAVRPESTRGVPIDCSTSNDGA